MFDTKCSLGSEVSEIFLWQIFMKKEMEQKEIEGWLIAIIVIVLIIIIYLIW